MKATVLICAPLVLWASLAGMCGSDVVTAAGIAGEGTLVAADRPCDVSVADFPRRKGETDDAGRLQRAIDATGPERVLYVPCGVYEVSRMLVVTNAASLLLHKSATVRAVARMPYVLSIDMSRGAMWNWGRFREGMRFDQGLFLRGGHIDGNGLASCVFLQKYFHFSLRDVVFLNGSPYGLHVGASGAEIIANNLYFRTLRSGLAGNVALYTEGSDSHYTDLFSVDYTTGVRVRGAANFFTRCHAWGGPVPPVATGRLPEMLEGSVSFDLGGDVNSLRDCYADTSEIGFLVSGWGQSIIGCCYYCNPGFHLKKGTVVRQTPDSGDLRIADGLFRAAGPETTLYEGPGMVSWRDMVYQNFKKGMHLPGRAVCQPDCPDVKTADDWDFVSCPRLGAFVSAAGEFANEGAARALSLVIPQKHLHRRFPNAGAGESLVLRARATDGNTQGFELTLLQEDGQVWGKDLVSLTRDWREIRIPFAELRYFSHYRDVPALKPGDRPDARKMTCVRCVYGNWMCGKTAALSHGFEISSARIVGR